MGERSPASSYPATTAEHKGCAPNEDRTARECHTRAPRGPPPRGQNVTPVPPAPDAPVSTSPARAPVFVLGVHRSGTTWLTSSLAETGLFAPYSVRHLLEAVDTQSHTNESAAARLAAASVVRRPGDGLAVTPTTSEEYGYLYALHRHTSRTTINNKRLLAEAITQLQREHPERHPVLRNPWDYAASHRLAAWFPEAKFVFVHRDPADTVGSAVEMVQEFWRSPHPYAVLMSPRYRRLWASGWKRRGFQWAARHPTALGRLIGVGTSLAHQGHFADVAQLPAERCVHVRYSAMVDDLDATLRQVLDGLSIQGSIGALPPPSPRPERSRPWLAPLRSSVARWNRRYVQERLSPAPELPPPR